MYLEWWITDYISDEYRYYSYQVQCMVPSLECVSLITSFGNVGNLSDQLIETQQLILFVKKDVDI